MAPAQMAPTLTVAPLTTVRTHKGASETVAVKAVLPAGFHANSNTPSDAYLVPLSLKWTTGPMQVEEVTYPKPALEKYSFSEKPLSVVTGEFTLTTKFKIPAGAPTGPGAQNGTLRYQACNDRMCFAPKTVPVTVAVTIE